MATLEEVKAAACKAALGTGMKTIEDVREWLVKTLDAELPDIYASKLDHVERYTRSVRCNVLLGLLSSIEGDEKSETTKRLNDLIGLQQERAANIRERLQALQR